MEWISAFAAMEALGPDGPDFAGTPQEEILLKFVAQGEIRSRARELVVKRKPREWGVESVEWREELSQLDPEFWRMWDDPKFVMNWRSSFAMFAPNDEIEWRAHGVEFSREDVVKFGGQLRERAPAISSSGKRVSGRKEALHRWEKFYFAVIDLALDGRLSRANFPTRSSLNHAIEMAMGDDAFAEDHARKAVRAVYERYIGD